MPLMIEVPSEAAVAVRAVVLSSDRDDDADRVVDVGRETLVVVWLAASTGLVTVVTATVARTVSLVAVVSDRRVVGAVRGGRGVGEGAVRQAAHVDTAQVEVVGRLVAVRPWCCSCRR